MFSTFTPNYCVKETPLHNQLIKTSVQNLTRRLKSYILLHNKSFIYWSSQ